MARRVVIIAAAPPSWDGAGLSGNWDVVWYYTQQHARYTLFALVLGMILALPLAFAAVRRPSLYPPLLVATNIIYAVPAITMFIVLSTWLGFLNDKPIIVAMALYTLVILVRSLVESIRAVPEHVVQAAEAMGYTSARRFVSVELPLALPGVVAGLRLAAVSTVSLISVGALIGRGAIGRMFTEGRQRRITTEIWSALVAVVVLALVLDLVIFVAGRAATPWIRAGRGRRRRRDTLEPAR